MNSSAILLNKGMKCLIDNLGEVDAERFITQIIREPFDYTKWQRDMFSGKSVEEIFEEAEEYCEKNPR